MSLSESGRSKSCALMAKACARSDGGTPWPIIPTHPLRRQCFASSLAVLWRCKREEEWVKGERSTTGMEGGGFELMTSLQ